MTCGQAEEQMQRHLDGDLQPEEEQALQRHLAACPDCQHRWAVLQELGRRLASLPPVTPPVSLVDRLEGEWNRKAPSRRWSVGMKRFTWGAGGMAAALLLVWWMGTDAENTRDSATDTTGVQQHSTTDPAHSDEPATFGIQSGSSPQSSPSPDGSWLATQDDGQIRITDPEGNEAYRSRPWEEGAEVHLSWEEEEVLHLHLVWPDREEERWIDMSGPRERNRPPSSEKVGD
ncbi:zf-HC2 domain-containing protein [Desmospora profundinema]|uniref:Anti-sigma-W factor RsiW n=1 Tax=Desmospora profundinema TaxID=1571184 RepID=A0ABU1IJZ6_9BACL|nr:zf-HC2 domain-containing protein [Desmospora profundinema]MDR6225083.1 hypothetical protein [Desmospora profundinema]